MPKARCAMTVGHCNNSWGSGGAVSPPVGPGQSPGGDPGGEGPGSLGIFAYYSS